MTVFAVTTDQTTKQSVEADDTLFLLEGISIAVTGNDGIETLDFTDNAIKLQINGSVFGALDGIDLISTSTGNDNTGFGGHHVIIGATGSVTGVAEEGIDLLGTNNIVTNYGAISGLSDDSSGIRQNGDYAVIQNHGSITGDFGILLLGNGDGSDIINSGTITGRDAAIRASGQTINLVNTGLISAVGGSSGDDAIDILNGNFAPSFINNSGTIIGGVSGPQDQVIQIINSGMIDGSVEMSDQGDLFDGRGGTVTGPVAGNDGNDTYIVDDANIDIQETVGDGNDTVKSTVNFELGDFIEKLNLIGADDIDGTGNALNNVIVGNAGDNVLRGGDGSDTLNGNNGNDILRGGVADDTLRGGAGDDTLRGGFNADELRGGDGDDVLIGGVGKDELFGQDGSDVFRFKKASHSTNNAKADLIKDFVQGEDLIDLKFLASGALDFIGGAGFGGTGPGEVRVSTSGSDTLVRVDVDGDGSGDMRIVVEGVTGLMSADFLL